MVRVFLLVYLDDGERWFLSHGPDGRGGKGNESQELGGGGAYCGV